MKCVICNKDLIRNQKRVCSIDCRRKYMSIWNKKNGVIPPIQKGKKWSKEQKEKHSILMSNRINPMKNPVVIKKLQERKKITYDMRGRKTDLNKRIRMSLEYKLFRKSVFERDKYQCRFCGIRGGYLIVDHIKPFAYYPELRFAIDNGRTLCRDCHKKTDTYGILAHKHKPL